MQPRQHQEWGQDEKEEEEEENQQQPSVGEARLPVELKGKRNMQNYVVTAT